MPSSPWSSSSNTLCVQRTPWGIALMRDVWYSPLFSASYSKLSLPASCNGRISTSTAKSILLLSLWPVYQPLISPPVKRHCTSASSTPTYDVISWCVCGPEVKFLEIFNFLDSFYSVQRSELFHLYFIVTGDKCVLCFVKMCGTSRQEHCWAKEACVTTVAIALKITVFSEWCRMRAENGNFVSTATV